VQKHHNSAAQLIFMAKQQIPLKIPPAAENYGPNNGVGNNGRSCSQGCIFILVQNAGDYDNE